MTKDFLTQATKSTKKWTCMSLNALDGSENIVIVNNLSRGLVDQLKKPLTFFDLYI